MFSDCDKQHSSYKRNASFTALSSVRWVSLLQHNRSLVPRSMKSSCSQLSGELETQATADAGILSETQKWQRNSEVMQYLWMGMDRRFFGSGAFLIQGPELKHRVHSLHRYGLHGPLSSSNTWCYLRAVGLINRRSSKWFFFSMILFLQGNYDNVNNPLDLQRMVQIWWILRRLLLIPPMKNDANVLKSLVNRCRIKVWIRKRPFNSPLVMCCFLCYISADGVTVEIPLLGGGVLCLLRGGRSRLWPGVC